MGVERFLTEAELLAALNTQADRTAVWRWRKKGMPHVKVGRSVRYDLAAVKAWLAAHAEATPPSPAPSWDWSVWMWDLPEEQPDGSVRRGNWYEWCRCRNEADALDIQRSLKSSRPWTHEYRVSQNKPEDLPAGEEGGTRGV